MTLQQLRYFLEIARTKRFTAAANSLYVAQSSLSYAIHELEHELGVPLFIRGSNKKVMLTEYGQKFLPYAEQIFTLLDEGERELKSLTDPLSGTVKLGFFYCVANAEIPRIFRRFYDDNPDSGIFLDFDVNQGSGAIEELLQLGKYDMIISTSRSIKDCGRAAVGKQLLKVIVPDNHPLAGRGKISLEEIKDETLLGLNQGSNLDLWVREMFGRCGLKPDITFCPDWVTQFGYVAMGYGVAVTSSMPMYQDYIVELDIDHPMIWRELHLFWPTNRKLSKAAEFVRDYVIALTKTEQIIG